jgi:hypothetical protein
MGAKFDDSSALFAHPTGNDWSEVSFRGANLSGSDFSGAQLSRADFSDAYLSEGNFDGANLTGACFRGAKLGYATFRGAQLDRADFENAFVGGAVFSEPSAVLGLDLAGLTRAGAPGDRCRELDAAVARAGRVIAGITLQLADGTRVILTVDSRDAGQDRIGWRSEWNSGVTYCGFGSGPGVSEHFHGLARRFGHGRLLLDSVVAKGTKCEVKGKALRTLITAAWSEVFRVEGDADSLHGKD